MLKLSTLKVKAYLDDAAEQGYATAQCLLGDMYSDGAGVTKDYKLALKWYRESAEQGNADAQHSLGNMYLDGKGVAENYELAVKWFKKAAKQGHAGAKENLKEIKNNNYSKGK